LEPSQQFSGNNTGNVTGVFSLLHNFFAVSIRIFVMMTFIPISMNQYHDSART